MMKQHLLGKQLKELEYEDRLTLLSLVVGQNRQYLTDEYKKGLRNEDGMLMEYAFKVNVGEMIEIIQSYTGEFPMPTIQDGNYSISIDWITKAGVNDNASAVGKDEYCDALYEIIKDLFKKHYIDPIYS